MTRDDILRMADEAYELAKKDLLNGDYLTTGFLAIRDIHFHRLATAAERNECERLKHAMREAMYLLDQPEPRPHAAFSELLCALNPDLPSAIRARGSK
jgi:hypothetical protein